MYVCICIYTSLCHAEPPTTPPTTPPTEPPTSPSPSPVTTESRETGIATPTARASTGNDTTYQIVLIIEAVIIVALLLLIIFTAFCICKTPIRKTPSATEDFGYTAWSPDTADEDPGMA